jgi:hypothetical protein
VSRSLFMPIGSLDRREFNIGYTACEAFTKEGAWQFALTRNCPPLRFWPVETQRMKRTLAKTVSSKIEAKIKEIFSNIAPGSISADGIDREMIDKFNVTREWARGEGRKLLPPGLVQRRGEPGVPATKTAHHGR